MPCAFGNGFDSLHRYATCSNMFSFNLALSRLSKLMNSQGLLVMDLRHTLPNLKYFILAITSPQNQTISNHKRIPHNCTIPSKARVDGSVHGPLYHLQPRSPA